jgi:hypothetical protein
MLDHNQSKSAFVFGRNEIHGNQKARAQRNPWKSMEIKKRGRNEIHGNQKARAQRNPWKSKSAGTTNFCKSNKRGRAQRILKIKNHMVSFEKRS